MTTTADQLRSQPAPVALAHEHAWATASRHRTSEGDVLYVRCGGCGAHRVDVQSRPDAPPSAISAVLARRA